MDKHDHEARERYRQDIQATLIRPLSVTAALLSGVALIAYLMRRRD